MFIAIKGLRGLWYSLFAHKNVGRHAPAKKDYILKHCAEPCRSADCSVVQGAARPGSSGSTDRPRPMWNISQILSNTNISLLLNNQQLNCTFEFLLCYWKLRKVYQSFLIEILCFSYEIHISKAENLHNIALFDRNIKAGFNDDKEWFDIFKSLNLVIKQDRNGKT